MTRSILTNSGTIRYNNSSLLARPLHVEGNQIKNDLGAIVYLRGWSKTQACDKITPTWGAWGEYLQSKVDLELYKMKSYDANVLRHLLVVNSWINNLDCITETGTMTYRQLFDDLITRCEQRGIYLIIAPYTIYPRDCPIHGWANCEHDWMGYDPYTGDGHRGVVPDATAFKNFVVSIVDVLGSHVNLIIEPYNEPWVIGSEATLNAWQAVWQSIIDGIRQKETEKGYVKHLILVQYTSGLHYYGDLTVPWTNFNWYWTHPLTDPANNLVYSHHCYRYWGAVGGGASREDRPYDYDTLKQIYIEEKVLALSQTKPVIIAEIGAHIFTDSNNGEYLFLQNSLRIFDEWNLSYLGWVWGGAGTPWDQLESGTDRTTGGTVNKYGQLLVDAMKTP